MSAIAALLTPEGLAAVAAVAGALGLKSKVDKGKKKLADLVELADRWLTRAKAEPVVAAAIAGDPDRALEVAIQMIADAAGIAVNAKQLREAVGQLVLRHELERRQPEIQAFLRNMEIQRKKLEALS